MGNLDTLQALGKGNGHYRLLRGTVILQQGATAYSVSVNGNVLPASAAESVAVKSGDSVLVAWLLDQAEAIVLCRLSDRLNPATGTVATVPPSSPTVTVTGADGGTYTAYFLSSYTPTVGDNVEMIFLGGYPYVTKTGTTPAPPAPVAVAPPPSGEQTGTTPFAAADSATYWSGGGWGSWGKKEWVYSGTYGGSTVNGAWFYAGGPGQLAGRTILGGRFVLGARMGAGSYNAPATVNIYTHSSAGRPGGNVTLLNGPTTVVAQPWQGLTEYALTAAQAADIVNGGGIAIVNGDYAAFQGIQANAQSGTVYLDWKR